MEELTLDESRNADAILIFIAKGDGPVGEREIDGVLFASKDTCRILLAKGRAINRGY